jgi:hypothetical protein
MRWICQERQAVPQWGPSLGSIRAHLGPFGPLGSQFELKASTFCARVNLAPATAKERRPELDSDIQGLS